MKKVVIAWSGGKDSCLAYYKARQMGYSVTYILNTISQEFKRVNFHGVEDIVIQKQAEAIGVPLLQIQTTPFGYENEFKKGLAAIKKTTDIDGLVCGDIYLEECFARAKRTCDALQLQLIEPLWQQDPVGLMKEFIDLGFEAIVVSAQASVLGKEWVGRAIDKQFLKDIQPIKNVDPCGENGEYHTLVIDGPLFSKRIAIEKSKSIRKGTHWFLDIQKYSLNAK